MLPSLHMHLRVLHRALQLHLTISKRDSCAGGRSLVTGRNFPSFNFQPQSSVFWLLRYTFQLLYLDVSPKTLSGCGPRRKALWLHKCYSCGHFLAEIDIPQGIQAFIRPAIVQGRGVQHLLVV